MSTDPTMMVDADGAVEPSHEETSDAWIGAPRLRTAASFGVRAAVLAGLALGATAATTGLAGPPEADGGYSVAYTTCCPPSLY